MLASERLPWQYRPGTPGIPVEKPRVRRPDFWLPGIACRIQSPGEAGSDLIQSTLLIEIARTARGAPRPEMSDQMPT